MRAPAILTGALVLAGVALGGCTTRHGPLSVASTEIDTRSFVTVQQQVSGRDCHQTILFFGLRTEPPTLRRAVAQALSRVPGATALADVEIYRDLLVTVLYNRSCVRVEGRAVVGQ